MNNYWLSWYATRATGAWELHWPWWISGYRIKWDDAGDDVQEPTVCAAVRADSEDAAKEIVLTAHDKRPVNIEWRFCEQQPQGWSPFSERFPRADWMQWPMICEMPHE